MPPNWILIFLGAFAILAELVLGAATGFDLALIGTACVAGGIAGNITDNWQLGIIVSIILTALYILFGRNFVKNKLNIKTNSTNIDNLIGKTGLCLKKIAPHEAGQVRVENEIWRAESLQNIEKDDKITVESVEGVSLKVTKIVGSL